MMLRSIPIWSISDLKNLYSIIILAMPSLSVDPDFLPELLSKSNGNPRFLKAFLRHKSTSHPNAIDYSEIMQTTINQFDW